MGGSSKSAPTPPDPRETAGYQTGTSIGMTKFGTGAGLTGTNTPYGTSEWDKTGKAKYTDPYTGETYKAPKYQETVTLSPAEQAKYDASNKAIMGLLGQANSQIGGMKPLGSFDYGADIGAEAYTPGADLSGEAWSGGPLKLGNEATEARIAQMIGSRLTPRLAQEETALDAKLTAQGLRPGTAAWNAAKQQQGQRANDAWTQANLQGRAQAVAETQAEYDALRSGNMQRFNQLVAARTLGAGEQAQRFGQLQTERGRITGERGMEVGEQNQAVQRIAQLLGFGSANMPGLTGQQVGRPPVTDVAGLIQQGFGNEMDIWKEKMAQMGGMFGGAGQAIGSIGGALLASDERIKDNVKQVGTTQEGLPIYEFSIGDGPMQTGVMAQDVEAAEPGAVVEGPGGIKGVNYDQINTDGTYTVAEGDNIWDIGERLGVDPREIIAANPEIENPDIIIPGQKLVVPGMAAPGPAAIPLAAAGVPAVAEALLPGSSAGQLSMDINSAEGAAPGLMQPTYPGGAGGARPDPTQRLRLQLGAY